MYSRYSDADSDEDGSEEDSIIEKLLILDNTKTNHDCDRDDLVDEIKERALFFGENHQIYCFSQCVFKYRDGDISKDVYEKYLNEIVFAHPMNVINELVCVRAKDVFNVELLQRFMEEGFDPNYDNFKPFRMACCSHEQFELIKFLVENGADVNACNSEGLANAISYCYDYDMDEYDFTTVEFLLEVGTKITEEVIKKACNNSVPEIFTLLIKFGCNPNTLFKNLLSEKHVSAISGQRRGIKKYDLFIQCLKIINDYEPNYTLMIDELYNELPK